MKIVCLYGSPRKNGNSATIANHFIQETEHLGATVSTYSLNQKGMRGCQACRACKTDHDQCVVDDAMAPILADVKACDILVLATPVYFGDISAQMKMFIDRTYSYFVPDFLTNANPSRLDTGKKLVFIQSQAQQNQSMFKELFSKYELFFKILGFKDNHFIRACGVNEVDDVATFQEDVLEAARETARQLMS